MAEKKALREAYGETLLELGRENEKIVVLDADLGNSTKSKTFAKEFPERFFDMGIAECNLAGTAAGMAISGHTVFMSSFAMFAVGRCYEIIRNSICYPRLNVKIAATHAGITVGEDGASHQCVEDIGLTRMLPGMQVFVPADATECREVIKYMAANDGPMYLRMGRSGQPVLFDDDYEFKPGKAAVLKEGSDCAVFACGLMVSVALESAEALAEEGINISVINVSSIKPIDKDTITEYAKKCGCAVTAEEHSVINGLGSAVAEVLLENYPCKLKMVGVQDRFGQSGKPADLLKEYGLTSGDICKAVKEIIK